MADDSNKIIMVKDMPDDAKCPTACRKKAMAPWEGESAYSLNYRRRANKNVLLCIENFIKKKKKSKNQRNYLTRQKRTLDEMAEHGPLRTDQWAEEYTTKWYIWKSSEEISRNTFIREVKTVKAFWLWVTNEKRILDKSPAEGLVCPAPLPSKGPVMKIIHEQDVINSSQVLSQRAYAAVVIIYTCGLRATEVEKLRESHIPRTPLPGETTFLTVPRTKLRKQRLVPIPNEVTLLALDYLTSRTKKITSSEIFSEIARSKIEFTPQQLRNTAIQRWIKSGENIHTVSSWAGHSSVETTAKFIPKPKKIHEPKEKQDETILQ